MTLDDDIQTVMQALGELSTYGDHASQHPFDLPAVAALGRVTARLAEVEAERDRYHEDFDRAGIELAEQDKRIDPLEAENEKLHRRDLFQAENDRLRSGIEALVENLHREAAYAVDHDRLKIANALLDVRDSLSALIHQEEE